jgi:hypothetical protein
LSYAPKDKEPSVHTGRFCRLGGGVSCALDSPTISSELVSQPTRRSDPQSAAPVGIKQTFSQEVGCLIFVQLDEAAFANGLGAVQRLVEPVI